MIFKKFTELPLKRNYLLRFGYIGTEFNGIQRQNPYDTNINTDVTTIQGLMEYALQNTLQPLNQVKMTISSRTDAGVHAFNSSSNVVLEFPFQHFHNPQIICKNVNKFFASAELEIRLHSAQHVSDDFNARFAAIWRKYVYRMAVIKDTRKQKNNFNFTIPITEHNRCSFVLDYPFINMELAKKCAKIMEGTHDFSSFMGKSNELNIKPIRTISKFDITPGRPFYDTPYDSLFDFWDFTVYGRAFLYKQVRKMATTMMYIAQGRLTQEEFQYMLDNPSVNNWKHSLKLVPSSGLYLMDIGYREEDLIVPKDNIRFILKIHSIHENHKLETIKIFRELYGCTVLQARDMMKTLPVIVRNDMIEKEALYYKEMLETIQCEASIEKTILENNNDELSEDSQIKSTN